MNWLPLSFLHVDWLEQELLAEREALRQEEKRSNEIIQKVEHENDLLKRKLASSEQRAELANAAAEKTYAVLRKDNQRLEASCASMLQRCRFYLSGISLCLYLLVRIINLKENIHFTS